METQIDKKTVEKINALIALANDKGANENEATNASMLVIRLMAKNNLTIEKLQGINDEEEAINDYEVKLNDKIEKRFPAWKSSLIDIIAEVHFCYAYFSHRTKCPIIVGTPSNVQSAKILYSFLCQVIEDESTAATKAYVGYIHGKTYKNSFKVGMVDRIYARFSEEKRKIMSEYRAENTKDVVVYDLYKEAQQKAKQFISKKGVKLSSNYSNTRINSIGHGAGYQAGSNIPLHASRSLRARN